MRKLEDKPCEYCRRMWKPALSTKRFCSIPCANRFHWLGKKGERHSTWKGGFRRKDGARRRQPSGYIEVYVRERRCWVGEHRLIMEAKLGRRLLHTEHVHHINAIRDDNRTENLVVLTNSAHNSLEKPKQVSGWKRNEKGQWI